MRIDRAQIVRQFDNYPILPRLPSSICTVNTIGRVKENIQEEINNVEWLRSLDNDSRAQTMLKSIFLSNEPCVRRRWICSGVKYCPYLYPETAASDVITADQSTFAIGAEVWKRINAKALWSGWQGLFRSLKYGVKIALTRIKPSWFTAKEAMFVGSWAGIQTCCVDRTAECKLVLFECKNRPAAIRCALQYARVQSNLFG